MGGLRDKLLAESIEKDAYLHTEDISSRAIEKTKKSGIKGKTHSLPAPFNKKTDVLEKAIQKEILQGLKGLNIFYRRVALGAKLLSTTNGTIAVANELAGHPDIMCIINGMYIPIEINRAGGKLSCEQWAIMLDMQKHGAYPIVACSSDVILLLTLAKNNKEEFMIKYWKLCEKLNFQFPVL